MPEQVLVGLETGDDAAVYALPDGRALVQTVDFFTPIVDDPYDWGRIGAANSLSDVYATGGRPALALNLVGWPVDELPLEILGRVLEGGAAVATPSPIPCPSTAWPSPGSSIPTGSCATPPRRQGHGCS